jgi:predicted thioredoxin/glutaredoxin
MTKDAWMKLSSTITYPDGTVLQRVRVKEEDYVPEWAGLMTVKSDDPLG